MADTIQKLDEVPEAFADIAAKINELVAIVAPFQSLSGQAPIKVDIADANVVISLTGGVAGASGTDADGTYEEFTICDSGVPASRWWLTFTSDPSA